MATDHAYPVLEHCHHFEETHESAPHTPKSTYTNISAPTVKKRGYQFNGNLDAGPQFAIKRRDYNGLRSVDPAWPIFCCDSIPSTIVESDPLEDFKITANNPIRRQSTIGIVSRKRLTTYSKLNPSGANRFTPFPLVISSIPSMDSTGRSVLMLSTTS